MAFPYIFESNFAGGSDAEWDGAETDTETLLDYPNYRTLAAYGLEPYSGAYCARIVATAASTADAVLTESSCNIADGATNYFRFNVYFGNDLDATANNTCALLELQGAAGPNDVTVACGFRYVALTDVINMGVGGAAAGAVPDNWSPRPFKKGVWYTIELCVYVDTGGGGTVSMYAMEDKEPAGAAAEAEAEVITNIAVTHAVFGLHDHLITTSGTILLDNFVQDNARLYKPNRYPEEVSLTKTGHAFIGQGQIEEITLLPGSAAGSIHVYDSDGAETVDLVTAVLGPVASASVTRVTPVNVSRGAHCVLAGQGDPRALLKLKYAPHSAASVRDAGMRPR